MTILDFGSFGIGIIDIVLVVAAVIFAVVGWKKGFLNPLLKILSFVVVLLASFLLAKAFSVYVNQWVGEAINLKIGEYLSESPLFAQTLNEANVREAFGGMSLPQFMVDWIVEGIDFEALTTTIIEAIQPMILDIALVVISFIALFIGLSIGFLIVKLIVKGITNIPVIREIDKGLGVLFGLVKVVLIVCVLFFVLGLLMAIPSIGNSIGTFINEDMGLQLEDQFRLSKWIYDNNLLKQIIDVFF